MFFVIIILLYKIIINIFNIFFIIMLNKIKKV